ncbi:MAG: SEC-C domain-containing protein [bacterium]|nr:SEC-C domain-containing protein [bacterium]
MTVIEKITEINDVIKEIFGFTQSNETVQKDFSEYLATIGARQISLNQMEKVFLPYIFERKIGMPPKGIVELFLEEGKCSNAKIAESLKNSQNSIFEIKRILKNGFELLNLVNEKTYTVSSLTKMTNFRGIYAGQYIVARIFEYEDEYFVIEISNVLSHSQKSEAMRFAVMKLIQNPRLLYQDSEEKEAEIKNIIDEMYKKFIKTFDKDIILTTNKHADEIIGAFNDGEEIDLTDKLSNLEEYKFFHVKELDNNYSNFLENSLGGFSSHDEIYDVAVIFDKENGLYAVPFYETFTKIIEGKEIENAKDCILYFLKNDSIPDTILKRIASENKNFMDVINKFLEKEYTFEDLIKEYKSEYLENKIYSSATVLYCSNAFSQVFDILSTPKPQQIVPEGKIGRNDPCPCGSGKKYKNCCGRN